MITTPSPTLLWSLAALLTALLLGSIARFIGLRNAEPAKRKQRLASLRTWWILTLIVGCGLLAGRVGAVVLLLIAGLMAFREYTGVLGVRKTERQAVLAGGVVAVISYLFILFDQAAAFVVFLPLAGIGVISLVQLLQGRAQGYILTTGGIYWGMMVVFYGMAHAAYLFIHPSFTGGPAGPAGWFLYLVILTKANDIFQAITGRAMGSHKKHRITPTVSPNKTWEGFFGGMVVTLGLAVLLAPWLTSMSDVKGALLAGLVIAVAGFFGDINMSAIKRDGGVKDGSNILPGMGGIIDRIDSLCFTAPAFLYLMNWWQG